MEEDANRAQCPKCGQAFKYPSYLCRHMARKTPCAPILERGDLPEETREDPDIERKQCCFCGRVFASYTSMRRHVRTTCKIVPNEKNGAAGMDRLYEHTIQKQEARIAALETQNAKMLGMVRQLVADCRQAPLGGEVGVQNQGDHNMTQVDNRHITVNAFGQEGLDHVTTERIRAILDESVRASYVPEAASAAVLRTAMLVYSDPDHPENLTCYLPNKKTNDALVRTPQGWEVRPTKLVLPGMAQKSVDALFAKQPYEDADDYAPLLRELADNEKRYCSSGEGGGNLRPILVRNKDLLHRALNVLPVATGGGGGGGPETPAVAASGRPEGGGGDAP